MSHHSSCAITFGHNACTCPTPVPPEVAETTAGEREVEALLLADCPCGHSIRAHDDEHICWGSECECDRDRYEAILASDWLSALLARVRREEGERIAQAIERIIPRLGVQDRVLVRDEAAAIARAASVGRGEGL